MSISGRRMILCVLALLAAAILQAGESQTTGGKTMLIRSKVFEHEGMIPKLYTCDGDNISPPLEWASIPQGTQSLALIAEDPDAPRGIWVHWVLYDLPADATGVSEAVPPDKELKNGARQGMSDFGKIGYGGPCPPGGTHRYYFRLYALDRKLHLEAGLTKQKLLKAMEGSVLATAEVMGTYQRK